ncbi:uncharacterized protein LOC115688122 isoform X1 [Syzygium oleosum]|uniref:uncharacterized protein LOC115688122 isoform X1 n=2 Tax=Syzygium oleosum TaxID=219896 RepID=UPI0011D1C7F0|nr:uncharacterized protein LOC115688122 isoform X1 [Syzygium oleosum]
MMVMTSVVLSSASPVAVGARITRLAPETVNWDGCRFVTRKASLLERIGPIHSKAKLLASCCSETMPRASSSSLVASTEYERAKEVWVWTENKQVMTAAVERGWNTFLFSSQNQGLADEWSSLALINPLFVEEGDILDVEKKRVAMVRKVVSPEDVQKLQPESEQAQIVVIDFADWQVIPAENIVATFQGSRKTVFAISRNLSEAHIFLEALEHGLGGVVLKVEDVNSVLDLKAYFDRRDEIKSMLSLEKAVITGVHTAGMGDRVCVDLCCLMKPGEGLLVGSFARGLFLVHSECMESDYISSRPFRVNAGPVHAYVAVPGGRTCYLSELKAGKEVIVIDQRGRQRTAVVGRVKIESRPLILVEAKIDLDSEIHYTILLQNAETVALVSPHPGDGLKSPAAIPVTSLKVGDEVVLRTQGGARHTGIEIQEFIVER